MRNILVKFICVALIAVCTLAMAACGMEASAEDNIDQDIIEKMSKSEAEAITAYIEERTALRNGDIKKSDVEYVGTILDRKISKKEFMARYQMILSGDENFENYGQAAWDSLKRDVWEKHFADVRELTPTKKEVKAYVEEVRGTVEATEKGRKQIEAYAESLDMTVDQYWKYIRKYVAPQELIHKRVGEYLKQIHMEPASLDMVKSTINDEDFFKSL